MKKIVLSNVMRHHVEHDNQRMREALRLIADVCEGQLSSELTRNLAKIARAALVSAPPENQSLRNPAHDHEGEANHDKQQ